ncbi:MAG: NAD(P)H-hydrate dehydratase [Phototrophicaceae bacterium]
MISIVSVEHMRRIEAAADASGLTYDMMMENAGRAAAQRAYALIRHLDNPRVTILVGGGNNGGDGLVAGRYLAEHEHVEVRFYMMGRRDADQDANFKAVVERELFIAYADDDRGQRVLRQMVASADLLLDALFGIGVRLPITGDAAKLLRAANQALAERRAARPAEWTSLPTAPQQQTKLIRPQVLAIDCPSGLHCDTGELDSNTIHADETITFIAAKPGLLTFPGAEAVGRLSVATVGVSPQLEALQEATEHLISAEYVRELVPPRPADSHKGTFGKMMIVAGSVNYPGAPALAARAAYMAGVGLVTIGTPTPVVSALSGHLPEPTWLLLPHDMGVTAESAAPLILEQLGRYQALLLGPGWGLEDTTGATLRALLEQPEAVAARSRKQRVIGFLARAQDGDDKDARHTVELPPLVLDADALSLLAQWENWWEIVPENSIITPHPAEMGRLCQLDTQTLQADRWQIAREKAAAWKLIVMLKGAQTVIAAPDGRLMVLPFKSDALATAGTGDVLAGIICGLLAQGYAPFDAAAAGGYLHGLAGELAAINCGSSRSVTASDVISAIPQAYTVIESA